MNTSKLTYMLYATLVLLQSIWWLYGDVPSRLAYHVGTLLGLVLKPYTMLLTEKTKSKSCAKYVGPARGLANLQRKTIL